MQHTSNWWRGNRLLHSLDPPKDPRWQPKGFHYSLAHTDLGCLHADKNTWWQKSKVFLQPSHNAAAHHPAFKHNDSSFLAHNTHAHHTYRQAGTQRVCVQHSWHQEMTRAELSNNTCRCHSQHPNGSNFFTPMQQQELWLFGRVQQE